MYRKTVQFIMLCLGLLGSALNAQEFKLFDRDVQVHGFATQGFIYTNHNNWLTMKTSEGSAAFTDFGGNISMQVSDKLRIGAQIYDRNLGQLDQWHPSLDWAYVDYRFKPWFGIRAGKVKTAFGLYNNTQDMEFLHTWALLPQSLYANDLRSETIAHTGGDAYGHVDIRKAGQLDYTVYGGKVPKDTRGGYYYGVIGWESQPGVTVQPTGFRQTEFGGDIRWTTPLKGLMVGFSAYAVDFVFHQIITTPDGAIPLETRPTVEHFTDYYAEYSIGRLRFDAEYKINPNTWVTNPAGVLPVITNEERDFFVSAAFRVNKWLEVGTYHSRYYPDYNQPHSPDTNHEFDQTVTARFDITRHMDLKVEEHFMDGYGSSLSFRGFYAQENPNGFQPKTRALVIRTGFNY